MGNQFFRDMGEIFQAHQKDQGSLFLRQCGVIQHQTGLVRALMSRNHMEGGRKIPVGHRNTRVSRSRIGGGYARNDFEFHARL